MLRKPNPLSEFTTSFAKMSYTPDIPAGSLTANEYNSGANVFSDIRGIRSVLGEVEIATALTGVPVYITGGYRQDSYFYLIVATTTDPISGEGRWYQIHYANGWITENITPGYSVTPTVYFPGYSTNINITEAWNGTTLIINDAINPPMFLQGLNTEFVPYKLNQDVTVYTIFPISLTTMIIQCNENLTTINVPYQVGETITVEQVVYPTAFNNTYTIQALYTTSNYDIEVLIPPEVITCDFVGDISGTTLTVSLVNSGSINVGDNIGYVGQTSWTTVTADLGGGVYTIDQTLSVPPGTAFISIQPYTQGGIIRPQYQWNYNPNWTALSAGFLRSFSTPNVGSILIAGNLTATDVNSVTSNYPNTVRWSQQFGLDQVPATWTPTIANIANELEVPLRGPVLDGFPCNGNFFVCSYWDTVVFSPINYQTTQIPILGVKLFNQGRGLLNSNCWVNADDTVYGLDARDLWVFNGQDFKPLGNQRIKNYLFNNLNPLFTNQVFLEFNAAYNQVEIYYPDLNSTGYCNKMISYRYDLDLFNPPRDVPLVIMATESPIFRTSNQQVPTRTALTATLINTPIVSTLEYKFGGASGLFALDPVLGDDGLEFVDPTLDFGLGDFTVECWVYGNDFYDGRNQVIWDTLQGGPGPGLIVQIVNGTVYVNAPNPYVSVIISSTALSSNTWYNIVVVRASGVTRLYINGVQSGSSYVDTNNYINTPFVIGCYQPSEQNGINGYIDEFRISDIARYTGTFTPQVDEFVNDANTLLLLHMNGANGTSLFPDDNLNTVANFDPGSRCVTFVRAVEDSLICQKDQGFEFVNNTPIVSEFRRDSVRLVEDFSTSSMVHRIMPIVTNVDEFGQPAASTGIVDITVGGANSAGAPITLKPTLPFSIDTETPWVQINQNVYRQNTIIIGDSSTTDSWICSAIVWQFTPIEDDR